MPLFWNKGCLIFYATHGIFVKFSIWIWCVALKRSIRSPIYSWSGTFWRWNGVDRTSLSRWCGGHIGFFYLLTFWEYFFLAWSVIQAIWRWHKRNGRTLWLSGVCGRFQTHQRTPTQPVAWVWPLVARSISYLDLGMAQGPEHWYTDLS